MTRNELERVYEAAYERQEQSTLIGDRHDAALLAVANEAARRERARCVAAIRREAEAARQTCAGAASVAPLYDEIATMLEARNG